jgi:hypothetical protein
MIQIEKKLMEGSTTLVKIVKSELKPEKADWEEAPSWATTLIGDLVSWR